MMISVIIPVYGSGESLKELYFRITSALENYSKISFEIIFIDDRGSTISWEIIKKLAILDKKVLGIKMVRNYGQHNALLCGIQAAQGDIIVTMDDDLQHPPEEIFNLLNKINEGFDVVYAPPKNEKHSFFRNIASRVSKITLQKAMGAQSAQNISAFRAFKTPLRRVFYNYQSPTVNIDVLLSWATSNFGSIQIQHQARKTGKSGYTFKKLVQHALNMITGFSNRPLRLASLFGFFIGISGLVILLYVLTNYFHNGHLVPGFTFLASLIVIFSGTQLLAIGIVGEYLARVYDKTTGCPAFLIAETTKMVQDDKF